MKTEKKYQVRVVSKGTNIPVIDFIYGVTEQSAISAAKRRYNSDFDLYLWYYQGNNKWGYEHKIRN